MWKQRRNKLTKDGRKLMALLLGLMLLLLPFAFSIPMLAEDDNPEAVVVVNHDAGETPDADETPATPETPINPAVPNTDPNNPETAEDPGTGSEVPESSVDNELIPRNFSNAPLLLPPSPGGVAINEDHFPDENFRAYLKRFDDDGDGVLSQSELDAVTKIDVSIKKISDLKGIEHFQNLEELDCGQNPLSTLDLSQNMKLVTLRCSYCELLTNINVDNIKTLKELYCRENKLTTLDVSNNPSLTTLDCEKNQLSDLDVRYNTSLRTLYCSNNQLTTLDVSKNPSLGALHCDSNQLSELDVSYNRDLTNLWCARNYLTVLDVSKNTDLDVLFLRQQPIKLIKCGRKRKVNNFKL